MATQRIVLATTKVTNNIAFTRQSLVDSAASINGSKAMRQGLEHDPHYVPLGKIHSAEVIDLDDETVLAAIADDTHSVTTTVHEPTAKRIVELSFPTDERPFILQKKHTSSDNLTVTVDSENFENMNSYKSFLDIAAKQNDVVTTPSMVRRSLTPEPLIQFVESNPELSAVLAWLAFRGEKFLRYTIDETARKTGDAISDKISERLKRLLGIYDELRSPDDREVTAHVIIHVQPQIHLLTKGRGVAEHTEIGIESLCRQLELHKDLLENADSVTFERRRRDDEWTFSYATTKSGKVISSEDCYGATLRRRDEMSRTIAVCLCLEHKVTREERHYETTAVVMAVEEDGRFELKFNSVPADLEDYEIMQVSLQTGLT